MKASREQRGIKTNIRTHIHIEKGENIGNGYQKQTGEERGIKRKLEKKVE